MHDCSFDCKYGPTTIKVRIENGDIFIKQPMLKELHIKNDELTKINFDMMSNPAPGLGYIFMLDFYYIKDGPEKRKRLNLTFNQNANIDLIEYLKNNFKEKSYLNPNDKQKLKIISSNNTYRIHSLKSVAFITVFLSIFAFIGVLFFAMQNSEENVNTGSLPILGIVFLFLSVLLFILMILILIKKLMVIETTNNGMKIRKLINNNFLSWDDVSIGELSLQMEKYYSEYMVSTDIFFVISIIDKNLKKINVKMTKNQASKFYKELYYRQKVNFEDARKAGAFL